uniref:Uncharacterized LOC103189611 n=1 Tax=Callorhinchus milii TaxID=7868 RepID=A0A4W3J246_CALMI
MFLLHLPGWLVGFSFLSLSLSLSISLSLCPHFQKKTCLFCFNPARLYFSNCCCFYSSSPSQNLPTLTQNSPTMLKILTKKFRAQALNEIQPFQVKIFYSPSDEDDSEDSEGENRELAQIDQESQREVLASPCQCLGPLCQALTTLDPLDWHSSEEELEHINREFGGEKRKWAQVNRPARHSDNTSSSDEEVKDLCATSHRIGGRLEAVADRGSPVLFSASPPTRAPHPSVQGPTGQTIPATPGVQSEKATPCKRHRQTQGDGFGRPSLDLEKMQQVGTGHPPHPTAPHHREPWDPQHVLSLKTFHLQVHSLHFTVK